MVLGKSTLYQEKGSSSKLLEKFDANENNLWKKLKKKAKRKRGERLLVKKSEEEKRELAYEDLWLRRVLVLDGKLTV